MNGVPVDRALFLTVVRTAGERSRARILVDSIRSFGGALSDCPIWLFEADPQKVPCGSLAGEGIRVLPLSVPDRIKHYYYAAKVTACARAEALAAPEIRSLIFLAPENLIVKPPRLFDLGTSFDAAVRPVHIRNVGLLAAEPVDDFWRGVYETVGVQDIQTTVESFIDGQHIRAYFNSAAFAANRSEGLFRRWFECFEALVRDRGFQLAACQDERHQVFLHQAVLTTLIATSLDQERIRTLPPDYVYPYNLHQDVPVDRRCRVLDDLVCAYYGERSIDPDEMDDIGIHEPLRSWLSAHP